MHKVRQEAAVREAVLAIKAAAMLCTNRLSTLRSFRVTAQSHCILIPFRIHNPVNILLQWTTFSSE